MQVITDEQMQWDIIKSMHKGLGDTLESTSMGGHAGQNKTRDKITARYFWPKITKQVAQYISACPACQKAKFITLQKTNAELHSIHMPNKIWTQIGIDLMGTLKENEEGYRYILTAINYFMKYMELILLRRKMGQEVGENLFKLICRYGCPEIIISDQGKRIFGNARISLQYTSISCITYQANELIEHTFISCPFNKQVFCFLYFQVVNSAMS